MKARHTPDLSEAWQPLQSPRLLRCPQLQCAFAYWDLVCCSGVVSDLCQGSSLPPAAARQQRQEHGLLWTLHLSAPLEGCQCFRLLCMDAAAFHHTREALQSQQRCSVVPLCRSLRRAVMSWQPRYLPLTSSFSMPLTVCLNAS